MLPQCAKTKLLGVKHVKQEANLLKAQQARDATVKGRMETEHRFSLLKLSSLTKKNENKHKQSCLPHRKGH